MNILITGSEGLIGTELIKKLTVYGHKIICLDLKKKNFYKSKNIFFIKINLLKKKKIFQCLKNKKIDLIIHLAAFLGVKKSEEFELDCLETNINSTRNILETCIKLGIKKIIFSSSSEVYGKQYKRPMKEEDQLSPVSAYGVSKVCCESYIKAYSKSYLINYNIVRFFNVYGNDQRKDFVISKFANLIANKRKIEIFGNGNQVRSYCHVSDAVDALIRVVNKGKKNTIYNIGNDLEPVNIKKLVKFFEIVLKKNIEKTYIPFNKSDRSYEREIFFRIPNIKKIKKDTGYKPRVKLIEGLSKILKK